MKSYESSREKTNNVVFEQVRRKLSCDKHRRWLEAVNFGFRKQMNCTIRAAKTKALISCAVTAQLICAFVFAYAECLFPHDAAHI